MPRTRPPYSPEFRRQIVGLVRTRRSPDELAREFEPTARSIGIWVAQADKQEGRREKQTDGLSTAERDELARLRRENKKLRLERDILSRAAAWFARETGAIAHFERQLTVEPTRDGITAARTPGKRPGRQPTDQDRVAAALKLVAAGLWPTAAARQLGPGRSTVYREIGRASI